MTLLLALASSLLLSKAPATLDDLKSLAGQKAWAELLERAEDVAAPTRDATWKELVAQAATGVVQAVKVEKDPFERAAKADAARARYGFLDQQTPFVTARDEAVLAGMQRCVERKDDRDSCWRSFGPYEQTLSPAGSLKAGKLLRKNGFVATRLAALFARAVGAKDAPACKDAEVAETTVAALDTPEDGDAAKAARQLAFEWCWSALEGKLKASMVGPSKYRLENACKAMREKRALSELQQDLCKDEGR